MTITGILRTFALLAASLSLTAEHADLSQVQTVYLLPMGNGFDQYLANRLTQLGPYRVVTDPKLADALFTDRLGAAFEVRFEELFPKPEEPAVPEPAKDEKDAKDEKNAGKVEEATSKRPAEQDDRVVPPSSFGRGKGTVFLVDRKSRRVIWSAFENPKSTTPEVLDSTAERLVKQLKRDLAAK
jgi:hypothetical protein